MVRPSGHRPVLMDNPTRVFLNSPVQFEFTRHRFPPRPSAIPALIVGEQSIPLLFVRNPRARRYVLRLRPDGTARVTIPRGGSEATARQFAERNAAWLRRQMEKNAARPTGKTAWPVGSEIFFRGESVRITGGPGDGPKPITFADQIVRLTPSGQEGAPDCRAAIERHLRLLAAVELPTRVGHFARQHGLNVQRVTVRDQKSRWGSCSRRGTISLNWRLIQVPAAVADYIILHELMHLRQMNHSRQFWQEVAQVCPDFREAERWLKAHGRLLR